MSDKNTKENNKSFFLYTGLIFVVALLIVIISCSSQFKVNKETSSEEVNLQSGIEERTAAVSQENARLLQENKELKNEIKQKEQDIENIKNESKLINDIMYNCNLLLSCNTLYDEKKYTEAKAKLAEVNIEFLSADMLIIYDDLSKKLAQQE